MRRLLLFFFLFNASSFAFAQDLIFEDSATAAGPKSYHKRILQKFPFGKTLKKTGNESDSAFANKLFVNGVELHHETISLTKWKNNFGTPVLTFGKFYMDAEQTEAIIVGVLLNPIADKTYKVIEVCEIDSECGSFDLSEVLSVFYFNDQVCILCEERCEDKWIGDYHDVFIYSNIIKDNKLQLAKSLGERCDYGIIVDEKGEEIDLYIGGGEKNTKFFPCKYNDYKGVLKELNEGQSLKLAKPDVPYLKKQRDKIENQETLGYLYLEKYYNIKSAKTSIRYKNDEADSTKKYVCGFNQTFGKGITYKLNQCSYAVMFETITFPNADFKSIKELVNTLFHDSENEWTSPDVYGPPAAGCSYKIKKSGKNIVLEIECGC